MNGADLSAPGAGAGAGRDPILAWIALGVFALALTVRVAWIAIDWQRNGPALRFGDEVLHWELACNLLQRGELVGNDGRYAARMPLYPLYLALFAPFGSTAGILAARLGQAVLGAAAAAVTVGFAGRVLGRRPALVAGVLASCDPFTVFFANLLLTEVLFTLLLVGLTAAVFMLLATAGPQRTWRLAACVVAGLSAAAVMARPSAAGLVVLLWLALTWLDDDRRRGVLRALVCAGVLGLALLPWGLRNRAVIGEAAWLGTNGGLTLYDAQGPQARGDSDQSFLQTMPELASLGEAERDRRLGRLAIEQMTADPARVLRLALVKLARTWSLTPNVAPYRAGAEAYISAVFMLIVLACAVVGLIRTRRLRRLHAVMLLPIMYFTMVHCIYVGSVRYRVPVMPLLEILAAAAFLPPSTRAAGSAAHVPGAPAH